MQPILELKARPRFCPIDWSLSMLSVNEAREPSIKRKTRYSWPPHKDRLFCKKRKWSFDMKGFWTGMYREVNHTDPSSSAGKSYWRGRFCTIYLLVLAGSDQLLFKLLFITFYKQATLTGRSTVLSLSSWLVSLSPVRIPWWFLSSGGVGGGGRGANCGLPFCNILLQQIVINAIKRFWSMF